MSKRIELLNKSIEELLDLEMDFIEQLTRRFGQVMASKV